ncbi:aldehyde dehydrogenase family protein [Pseudoclavibacter alba]|uniref:Aldehyde dehydrogenase family protein n=1 Tax=Pseudoclavibacter albus TaxID=272241 RepID=A0ABT2HZ54_9MICO|nr:aldehyde dehydrogenase family protein [Pseudoclavibacter alba]MCT2043600.1 aldehyde dehydrogenase family protein [Pseudoclavibacter alba]
MSWNTAQELLDAITDETGREVFDPATGELIGKAPVANEADLEDAIARAQAAQKAWAAKPVVERNELLVKAAEAIEAAAEPLAEILSREQGKPLNGPNARFEVGGCAGWFRANASFALEPETIVDDETQRSVMVYDPIGVVGAISPWNWPMMISVWQWAPSLKMGNTVVAKPASSTTLSVLALGHVVNSVLLEDLLIVVPASGRIASKLASDERIGKVMFTGSTEVGKTIAREAAGSVARVTLELGGNDAGIVLDDADPAKIAEGVFWGAFINTGQTCAALKRLYVPASIYDEVVDAVAKVAESTPMGVGLDEQNVLGPLQNKEQYEIVADLVEKARSAGARIVVGGNPDPEQPGFFYPSTIVADIENDNPLVAEEQFGPVLPIVKYDSLDQAIEWANALDVALGSSVWSSNEERALEVASRLVAGTTWINSHGTLHPAVPFGGAKQSGYGVEFGVDGLKHVAQPHVITVTK